MGKSKKAEGFKDIVRGLNKKGFRLDMGEFNKKGVKLQGTTDYNYINPNHYKNNSKETWEMMVDIWGKEAFILHCEMTAFKYRMRVGLKPDQPVSRDLEKAKWYEQKAKELRKQEEE